MGYWGQSILLCSQTEFQASRPQGSSVFFSQYRIGPADLTEGTLSLSPSSTIPTVTDNLYEQHSIFAYEIGISFEPTSTTPNENGEITWGKSISRPFTGLPRPSMSPLNKKLTCTSFSDRWYESAETHPAHHVHVRHIYRSVALDVYKLNVF